MNTDADWLASARAVLDHYAFTPRCLSRITQGLINLTVRVTASDGTRYVLQRLHPVFGDSVNVNLERVTTHLADRGMLTPRLVRTRDGALSVVVDGAVWRVLSHVAGRSYDALPGLPEAAAAGRLLGRFHVALADFDQPLVVERPAVHDLPRHLAHLDAALAAAASHPLSDAVAAQSAVLRERLDAVPPFAVQPQRLVHGDPKISNVMFDAAGRDALCLIDLDTLAQMPLAFELGDAMRSWCNPHAEDAAGARFDLAIFAAAIGGYLEIAGAALTAAERAAIVPATRLICLELGARFLADALEERYFAWDASRYASRGAHNLARARGQIAVADSLAAQSAAACDIVAGSA